MKKIIFAGALISFLLTGCATAPSKTTGKYALNSCPTCVADFQATPETRLLNLKITSDYPYLDLAYSATHGDYLRFGNIYLTKGSFDGVVRIPKDTTILVTGVINSDFDTVKGSKLVKPNENNIVVNLKKVSRTDELNDQYKKLSKKQKKELIDVVSSFDITLNSPRMLFSSKLAEANGKLNSFLIDMPENFKKTPIYSELDSVQFYMKLIDRDVNSSSISHVVNSASNKIKLLKSVINN
ncbi:hypothetical protein [Acinetobacter faecalis]|uniref:hypothetical protein n=1 Tax=Acinetobacter faecalis TaxID=2665161 RepID=UPI002A91D8B2|nr:hypothetical protein [Acinetobacter faecalis]MDY6458122.1 hypothetical protein [Acinetobacter faecalis]